VPPIRAGVAKARATWTNANQAGLPSSLIPAETRTVGPRLGFGLPPDDRTSIGRLRASIWDHAALRRFYRPRNQPAAQPALYPIHSGTLGPAPSTFAVRTAPQPNYYVGQAQVDVNGTIILSPNAQSGIWTSRAGTTAMRTSGTSPSSAMMRTLSAIEHTSATTRQSGTTRRPQQSGAHTNYTARTGSGRAGNRDLGRASNPKLEASATACGEGRLLQHSIPPRCRSSGRYSSGLVFQWFYTFTRSLATTDAGPPPAATAGSTIPPARRKWGKISSSWANRTSASTSGSRWTYYNSTNVPPHHIRFNGIYDLSFGKAKHFGQGRFAGARCRHGAGRSPPSAIGRSAHG